MENLISQESSLNKTLQHYGKKNWILIFTVKWTVPSYSDQAYENFDFYCQVVPNVSEIKNASSSEHHHALTGDREMPKKYSCFLKTKDTYKIRTDKNIVIVFLHKIWKHKKFACCVYVEEIMQRVLLLPFNEEI